MNPLNVLWRNEIIKLILKIYLVYLLFEKNIKRKKNNQMKICKMLPCAVSIFLDYCDDWRSVIVLESLLLIIVLAEVILNFLIESDMSLRVVLIVFKN